MRGALRAVVFLTASGVLAGCTGEERPAIAADSPAGAAAAADIVEVPVLTEVFESPRDTLDNIDSPAVWHGPAGENWVLATAKETDVIVVTDATSGEELRRVGGSGTEAGRLERPNGIAVVDDLAWVVERDNARVQVFSLPAFEPLGTYGMAELRKPYGIAIARSGDGAYRTWITDNYELDEDVIPPDSMLGERVREFSVRIAAGSLDARLANTFGDVAGEGVLRVVESIAVDPSAGRVLIAEEQDGASMIKVYSLDGVFSGRIIEARWFPHQAEGIVLYACEDGSGYWVATDQGTETNTFHVFDRTSLDHLGSFRGRSVRNTDGIALTQAVFGNFEGGAFYAVHDDGSIAAFRWTDIANVLGLRSDCVLPDRAARAAGS